MKHKTASQALMARRHSAQQMIDGAREIRDATRDRDVAREVRRIARAARRKNAGVDSVEVSQWDSVFTVRVFIEGLKSFNKGQLPRYLERLEDELGRPFVKSQDYADQNYRRFETGEYGQLNLAGGRIKSFSLVVHAFVKAESRDCRRIQIGEEVSVYKSPKYAFICS